MLLELFQTEFDQPLDLGRGKGRETFVNLFNAFPELVAMQDCIRKNARAAHDRPSGDFAGHLFDQLASHPVDLYICVDVSLEVRHGIALFLIVQRSLDIGIGAYYSALGAISDSVKSQYLSGPWRQVDVEAIVLHLIAFAFIARVG